MSDWIFIEKEEHGETGSPMPFWLKLSAMDPSREAGAGLLVQSVLGEGGATPGPDRQWGWKYHEGRLALMFRTAEDRMLARLSLY